MIEAWLLHNSLKREYLVCLFGTTNSTHSYSNIQWSHGWAIIWCIWQLSTELAKLSLWGSDQFQMCVPVPVGLALYARSRKKNLFVNEPIHLVNHFQRQLKKLESSWVQVVTYLRQALLNCGTHLKMQGLYTHGTQPFQVLPTIHKIAFLAIATASIIAPTLPQC